MTALAWKSANEWTQPNICSDAGESTQRFENVADAHAQALLVTRLGASATTGKVITGKKRHQLHD